MTAFTGSNYAAGATRIVKLNSLKELAGSFQRLGQYGDSLPVMYSYQAIQEIPLAWDNGNTFTTWYPTGTVLNIISEDTANGYAVKYRPLSSGVALQISAMRNDGAAAVRDMAAFPGISAYNLPSGLGGVTLTYQQGTALAGSGTLLDEVAAGVMTVGDAMMYLYASGYMAGDKDILTSGSKGQEWRCNLLYQ